MLYTLVQTCIIVMSGFTAVKIILTSSVFWWLVFLQVLGLQSPGAKSNDFKAPISLLTLTSASCFSCFCYSLEVLSGQLEIRILLFTLYLVRCIIKNIKNAKGYCNKKS